MELRDFWTTVYLKELSMDGATVAGAAQIADQAVEEYKRRIESLIKDDIRNYINGEAFKLIAIGEYNTRNGVGDCNDPDCMIHGKRKENSH